jgi:hypothetical protein
MYYRKKTISKCKKNYSSTSVRNLMMAYHLATTDKKKILYKLLQMVPKSVLDIMISSNYYAILDTFEESKKNKIFEKFGLPTNASVEQIICKIYEIEQIL